MTQCNRSARQHQQSRIEQHASGTDSYAFFNLLTGSHLLETVEQHLPSHRERLYPPTETLSMFLAQALSEDRSCQRAVNSLTVKRSVSAMKACSTNTSAYCQARQRLPVDMLTALVRCSAQLMHEHIPQPWLWNGRAVRLVDGTTLIVPDTPSNQAAFGQPSSQKAGLGMPQCRLVSLICLSTGAVLDSAIGPCEGKGSGETSLFRTMMDTLQAGEVLVGDAYYASYFDLCSLQARGVDAVFEQFGARRSKVDFRRGQRLGVRDHLIEYAKPQRPQWMSEQAYRDMPDTITVREVSTGNKVLVTTLLDVNQTSKSALKALYKDRWHVELDLRNIKSTLGMGTMSCKSAAMVEKELWVYLLAYNLIRLLMAQAAVLADLLPRQVSFKHTVQMWTAWTVRTESAGANEEQIVMLFELIAQRRVGHRPGRVEPRARKQRPSPYPPLNKPRHKARAFILKHGHPKKAKC